MSRRSSMVIWLAVVLLAGTYLLLDDGRDAASPASEGASGTAAQAADLGPADGRDLPAQDTGRVMVGEAAPDFSLLAYSGDVITLSDFRGQQNVILAFYRGHW